MVSSRDEQRSRPPATPPAWHTTNGTRAIWPTDTLAGGTWIAASQHGLVLAILNLNPDPPVNLRGVRGLLSRGGVIPALIAQPDAASAMEGLRHLPLDRFAPFRLIAASGAGDQSSGRVLEARWDRDALALREHSGPAVCFVSSGLGDHLVKDRLGLFVTSLAGEVSAGAQDEFHNHQWADRPEVSVRMSRSDARTVSVAAANVLSVPGAGTMWRVSMDYRATEESAAGRAIA